MRALLRLLHVFRPTALAARRRPKALDTGDSSHDGCRSNFLQDPGFHLRYLFPRRTPKIRIFVGVNLSISYQLWAHRPRWIRCNESRLYTGAQCHYPEINLTVSPELLEAHQQGEVQP